MSKKNSLSRHRSIKRSSQIISQLSSDTSSPLGKWLSSLEKVRLIVTITKPKNVGHLLPKEFHQIFAITHAHFSKHDIRFACLLYKTAAKYKFSLVVIS